MLSPINLKDELLTIRNSDVKNNVIEWGANIYKDIDDNFQKTKDNLNSSPESTINKFDFEKLDVDAIYHINHIQQICVDYRLRFLETTYFKGEYPAEAILKIQELERIHNTNLSGFRIVAPSALFRLKKADDPLLFAPMGNNYYYLIHKWGKDIHPLRKLKFWAVKNAENLGFSLALISLMLTLITYNLFFKSEVSFAYGLVLFLFYFKGAVGLALFYGISLGKNFSIYNWQSKHDKVC